MVTDAPAFRLRVVAIVLVSLFATLFARLWYVQVLNSRQYQEVAAANITREIAIEAPRGRILDVNGRLLVDNRVTTAVTVDVKTLTDAFPGSDARREMLTRLAVMINRSAEQELVKVDDLENRIARGADNLFDEATLALDVDPSLLVYLGEHQDEFPGVAVAQTTVRDYPYGTLAAHVLGYVGAVTSEERDARNARMDSTDPAAKIYAPSDEIGKTGVEAMFEDELRGVPGRRVFEVDAQGDVIRERLDLRRDPIPGNDVQLTIDVDLQAAVEDELERSLEYARRQTPDAGNPDFVAPGGAAVVLDPRDGRVRAMASYPTYDPAAFIGGISQAEFDILSSEGAAYPILNRAIQGTYAPGSTFKLITAYAALHTGLLDVMYPDGWRSRIDHEAVYQLRSCVEDNDTCRFRNSEDRVWVGIDLPESLIQSSDTYYYRIGEEFFVRTNFDDDSIQQAARTFGLGRPSGIAMPSEAAGLVPDSELYAERHEQYPDIFPRGNWLPGDNVNLAIGQGEMLVTPLQLADAYATFANGGTRYSPNIATRILTPGGEVVRDFSPRVAENVDLPPEIREPILQGLLGVTAQQTGTAYSAFNLPGAGRGYTSFPLYDWPVAGKTGTSEKDGQADTALFAAFGPVDNPALGVARGYTPEYAMSVVLEQAGFASQTAAPMVARVFERVASGTLEPAPTAEELEQCPAYALFQDQLAEQPEDAPAPTAPAGLDLARLAQICGDDGEEDGEG